MSTARSTPNIALIKYWGDIDHSLRIPANNNVAMTLDGPYVDVTVDFAEEFSVTSTNKILSQQDIDRFSVTIEHIRNMHAFPGSISIDIHSHIPPSIGLASSAAVFSALAKALSALIDPSISDKQISMMARCGSGSAARSIFGGFGALNTEGFAYQVADEHYWELHDIIIVPSTEEKKVGSTEGHASAWSSPHYKKRIADIAERRFKECTDAILEKDFEKLQAVAEEDAMNMHDCMETQDPPLRYLNEETHRIIDEVTELRKAEHLPVLYTMDAGPTVHLFCTDEARDTISAYANAQEGCEVFEAKTGKGAYIL